MVNACSPHLVGVGAGAGVGGWGDADSKEFYKSGADWFVGVFQPPRAVIPGVARRHLKGKSFVWFPWSGT